MSEKKELKKVIISEKTAEQMPSDFWEKLQKENNVQIIMVGNDLISDAKMIARKEQASLIILGPDEQKSLEELMDETAAKIPEVLEIQSLPKLDDIKFMEPKKKKKIKPFVPKTIGRPINKRQGGR